MVEDKHANGFPDVARGGGGQRPADRSAHRRAGELSASHLRVLTVGPGRVIALVQRRAVHRVLARLDDSPHDALPVDRDARITVRGYGARRNGQNQESRRQP